MVFPILRTLFPGFGASIPVFGYCTFPPPVIYCSQQKQADGKADCRERITKNMESRNDIIKRINNTINIYAADDQTLRELERVVTGWLAMKRKIKSRNNNKEVK